VRSQRSRFHRSRCLRAASQSRPQGCQPHPVPSADPCAGRVVALGSGSPALGDLVAVAEAGCGQCQRQPAVLPHVLGNLDPVDEELRGHACMSLPRAGPKVDPLGVLLYNDAAVRPAEPAQRLGRKSRPGQPLGQDPPVGSAAATRPDDLNLLVRMGVNRWKIRTCGSATTLIPDQCRRGSGPRARPSPRPDHGSGRRRPQLARWPRVHPPYERATPSAAREQVAGAHPDAAPGGRVRWPADCRPQRPRRESSRSRPAQAYCP